MVALCPALPEILHFARKHFRRVIGLCTWKVVFEIIKERLRINYRVTFILKQRFFTFIFTDITVISNHNLVFPYFYFSDKFIHAPARVNLQRTGLEAQRQIDHVLVTGLRNERLPSFYQICV